MILKTLIRGPQKVALRPFQSIGVQKQRPINTPNRTETLGSKGIAVLVLQNKGFSRDFWILEFRP